MAIVPKRKTSKSKKRKRRSHHAINSPNLLIVNGEKTQHRLVKFYRLIISKKNK